MTAAYAFTDYKSQGQTIPYLIIDLGAVANGKLNQFNAYVVMSRRPKSDNILLLCSFDLTLFTTPLGSDLQDFDKQLEVLN